MSVKERFLRYIELDTASNEESTTCPSSDKQWVLANLLVDEMKQIGVTNPHADKNGYVYGEVPANADGQPTIGFIAHMDTVCCVPTVPMNARSFIYEGGDITLNEEKKIVMREKDFPSIKDLKGQELIVTDGTTLLGSDDKAGIAVIMETAAYLIAHPEFRHGKVMLGFTPDEEIGRGADLFDVSGFGADFAYTLDGGAPNELEYENFNAAEARIVVHGLSIHPGTAKNKMLNATKLAIEFNAMVPFSEAPEYTDGYEGFYMLEGLRGQINEAEMRYILRDHDADKLEQKKARLRAIADYMNEKYGAGTVELVIRDQYRNMRTLMEQKMEVVNRALDAIRENGMTPECVPIRGGTDGATLTYMGLPCPNIGTGGGNCHGVYEYVSVDGMEKMQEVLLSIARAR